jgi:hypothetical protein
MPLSLKAQRLQERLETGIKNAVTIGIGGGLGFILTGTIVQIIAKVGYLPASTVRGTIFGSLGLSASALAAVYAADVTKLRKIRSIDEVFGSNDWERLEGVAATIFCGTVIFLLLGGRPRSLLPSEYCLPGAFSLRRSALLPTGTNYADPREKGAIDFAGRFFGCHTCGDMKAKDYIADHMPPNKFAKEANAKWYRRMFGGRLDVKQHFYPQCVSCSTVQSRAVNMPKPRPTKLHLAQLRLYHCSGVFIGWWWFWSWIPLFEA